MAVWGGASRRGTARGLRQEGTWHVHGSEEASALEPGSQGETGGGTAGQVSAGAEWRGPVGRSMTLVFTLCETGGF